ncbi:MAG: protein kinase domain-containing protein [Methylophilus sp.]
MEYQKDDLIDERFIVKGVCSNSGGMGQILFVIDSYSELKDTLALKYCRKDDEEYVKRFRREVRLLESFNGNSKIVRTMYSNTKCDPPYFVMQYYPDGDLTNIIDDISEDITKQEIIFNKMIDCISELHAANVYHRDIKPENFLIDGADIVVSDFGLGMEPGSSSRFTSSSMFWGTQGYLPPEYQNGGFKNADESGDIFMLGKSFYVLLTKQNPTYLMDSGIHPALFYVIERACALDKTKRYQTLSEMKQALQLAFDVILNRGGELGEVNQLISTIEDRLKNENKYNAPQVIEFLNKLALVDMTCSPLALPI